MSCYDRPSEASLKRFADLCELANGIHHLVDQYRQADAAASQWYEIAKARKRQMVEMKAEVERLRDALSLMLSQHGCGCGHPACSACRDAAVCRVALGQPQRPA